MHYDKNTGLNAGHRESGFDLDALLHPAKAFAHPMDVVHDSDLTVHEKRAILASWASDACAIEAAPALRAATDGTPVRWDDIMDALKSLDQIAAKPDARPRIRHWKRRRWRAGGTPDLGPQAC